MYNDKKIHKTLFHISKILTCMSFQPNRQTTDKIFTEEMIIDQMNLHKNESDFFYSIIFSMEKNNNNIISVPYARSWMRGKNEPI